MRRSLHFWLLLPLTIFTLFFAACGWRNWHLTNDQNALWIQCADLAINRTRCSSYDVLTQPNSPQSFVSQLSRRYPAIKFKAVPVTSLTRTTAPYISLGPPQFENRFKAFCNLQYRNSNDDDYHGPALIFTRSPLNPFDSSWHLSKIDEHPH